MHGFPLPCYTISKIDLVLGYLCLLLELLCHKLCITNIESNWSICPKPSDSIRQKSQDNSVSHKTQAPHGRKNSKKAEPGGRPPLSGASLRRLKSTQLKLRGEGAWVKSTDQWFRGGGNRKRSQAPDGKPFRQHWPSMCKPFLLDPFS